MKKLTIAVSLACLLVISNAKANIYDGKYCLNKDGQKEGMNKTSQKTWEGNKLVDYLQVKTNGVEASAKNTNYKKACRAEKLVQEEEWKARGKPIEETMISYANRLNVSVKKMTAKWNYKIGNNGDKSGRSAYYDKIIAREYNNKFVKTEKEDTKLFNIEKERLKQNELSASNGNRASLNFKVEKNGMQEFTKEKLVSKNTFTFANENNKG